MAPKALQEQILGWLGTDTSWEYPEASGRGAQRWKVPRRAPAPLRLSPGTQDWDHAAVPAWENIISKAENVQHAEV